MRRWMTTKLMGLKGHRGQRSFSLKNNGSHKMLQLGILHVLLKDAHVTRPPN